MAKTNIPVFATKGPFNYQLLVNWIDGSGCRFHIWFEANGRHLTDVSAPKWLPKSERVKFHGELRRVFIYKNPPVGITSGEGYFGTRKMDADANRWAAVLAAATSYANSGEPERIRAASEAVEEERQRIEAEKDKDAHGAATKERLRRMALEVQGTNINLYHALEGIVRHASNAEADRLSAYVHDLVRL